MVINLKRDTKLSSSTVGKGGPFNFYLIEFIYIFSQEYFCIAISYLQFTDVKKIKGNERCRIPIESVR